MTKRRRSLPRTAGILACMSSDGAEVSIVKPIVILSSGGIKSAACAARFANEHELILLHVDFGEPAAAAQRKYLTELADSLPHAATVSATLPHVAELEDQCKEKKRPAGRPDRGDVSGPSPVARLGLLPALMAVAVQCAVRTGARRIVSGLSERVDAAHLGLHLSPDHPDQIREWLYFLNASTAALLPSREPIIVDAPLLDMTYAEIVKQAFHFQTPFEHTWSCERAAERPCARCSHCQTRAAAFSEARLADPLIEPVSA